MVIGFIEGTVKNRIDKLRVLVAFTVIFIRIEHRDFDKRPIAFGGSIIPLGRIEQKRNAIRICRVHPGIATIGRVFDKNPVDFVLGLVQDKFDLY